MFTRDALVMYEGATEYDERSTEHFEQFQSTNWNSIRFKPPPSLDSQIGWRVEFRTLDVQLTDYENAAFMAFLTLFVQFINKNPQYLCAIPITKSDENLDRCHRRDGVQNCRFWWPENVMAGTTEFNNWAPVNKQTEPQTLREMTCEEIFSGSDNCQGLIPLLRNFVQGMEISDSDRDYYHAMLTFIEKRANGEILTGAQFIRKRVLEHPVYN